jgi:hypothetical protein
VRTLGPAPDSAIDAATRAPRAGSYRGGLPHVDLGPLGTGPLQRLARHKRWVYLGMATEEVYVGLAVVRLGYAANGFAFVYDAKERRMLADHGVLTTPFHCDVGAAAAEGCAARLRAPSVEMNVSRPRGSTVYTVDAKVRDLVISARMDTAAAPEAITAIAALPGGRVNTTEKRTLLSVTGEIRVGNARTSLDGALGGYDYTNGYLARRTIWRWGFALGRAKSGERVAFNVVEGFVGEAECALWVEGELFPLGEARFDFDAARPLEPWRLSTACGALDLTFSPGAAHADNTNLGVVASRFVQPAGAYAGRVQVPGRGELVLDGVLGVSEDQDVLW